MCKQLMWLELKRMGLKLELRIGGEQSAKTNVPCIHA